VPIVLKYGSLNLLEYSGPVLACNGMALPFLTPFNERWNQELTGNMRYLSKSWSEYVNEVTLVDVRCKIRITLKWV
jgi:hypothetical protein